MIEIKYHLHEPSRRFLVRWWLDRYGGNNTVLLSDSIAGNIRNNKLDVVSISGVGVEQLHSFVATNCPKLQKCDRNDWRQQLEPV